VLKTKQQGDSAMRTQRRSTPHFFRYSPLVAALAVAFAPGISSAVNFTVSNAGDNGGIDPAAGAATGTLRQALVDAAAKNASFACVNTGATIDFTGPFTINVSNALPGTTPLPNMDCDVVINATANGIGTTINGGDKSIGCGLTGNSSANAIISVAVTGFATGLCGSMQVFGGEYYGNNTGIAGNVQVYGTKIYGNNTGIQLYSGSVGDGTAALRNYIYSNAVAGISVNEGVGSIYHNYIGTLDGINPLGNGIGIDLQYTNATVTSNVISGNGTGVRLRWSSGAKLEANFIGTGPAGGSPLANTGIGVDNQCGNSVTLLGNTISGNGSHGVQSSGYIYFDSNHIGTDTAGVYPVPNRGAGIKFFYGGGCFAYGADIYNNDIAFNDFQGVTVTDTVGVWIEENRIFDNGGKNIDLGNNSGALPNDGDDTDTGANNQQNYPEITSVTQAGGITTIKYTLDSLPGNYYVEFFSNPADGKPAGQTYTNQYHDITLAATGAASFTYSFGGGGDYFSATATLNGGSPCCSTSEFSPRVKAAAGPTPSAYLTRSVLDFGDVAVGTSSGTLESLVVSSGTAPYTIDRFTDYGGGSICYGGPFSCQTDCVVAGVGATFESFNHCTLTATFDATTILSPGSYSRKLQIYDNTTESPRYIYLKANAVVPPPVVISPSSWDFGNILIGEQSDPQVFSINNPGSTEVAIGPVTTTGDFALQATDCGATVPAGASCGAVVAFYPQRQGTVFGTVQVNGTRASVPMSFSAKVLTDSTPTSATADLTGTGITQAQIRLPARIDMGAYTVGAAPLTRTVQLSNGGNSYLVITQISATAPFTVTTDCPALLLPGTVCNITVRFSSTVVGDSDGTLTIVSNGEGGSGAIPLHARTIALPRPEVRLSATTMGFGERLLGTTTASQRVTITNISNTPATIMSVAPSNEDFKVVTTSCGATLLPAATCFADIAMRPAGFGLRVGQFLFTSNALGSPHTIDLTGSGCRPYTPSSSRTGGPRSNCAP
jgi:hypothetical protein